ncbi:MAG: glutathione S-transferase N-terminal domain-containing protein [Myxococcales bacterium]|nr:glutathione S-transferase N-terminal domain-containing protein [Myxococcales bacterium]
MVDLYSLVYSPWSEKARWALDHHRIAYRRVRYEPVIGELGLRRRMGKWTGVLSVPVLSDGARWHDGSWAIARYAESVGEGTPLFPEASLDAIAEHDAASERGLAAGRALGLPRVLDDRQALLELVPRPMRRLGPVARGLSAWGVRRTMRKYATDASSTEDHERALRESLETIRRGLKATEGGGPETLLGRFSYADVTAAQVLQFVVPATLGGFRLGVGSMRAYSHPALAKEFADLAEWRDALYAHHRPESSARK